MSGFIDVAICVIAAVLSGGAGDALRQQHFARGLRRGSLAADANAASAMRLLRRLVANLGFGARAGPERPKTEKYPVKYPVGRESAEAPLHLDDVHVDDVRVDDVGLADVSRPRPVPPIVATNMAVRRKQAAMCREWRTHTPFGAPRFSLKNASVRPNARSEAALL
jgi:hypothetical protein